MTQDPLKLSALALCAACMASVFFVQGYAPAICFVASNALLGGLCFLDRKKTGELDAITERVKTLETQLSGVLLSRGLK